MTHDTLNIDDMKMASPSIFDAYDKDLKTTEKVLEQLMGEAVDQDCEWLAENLEVSMMAVKEKRVSRK